MAIPLDDLLAQLPPERQQRIEARAQELASLKDLRLALEQTQAQLAAALGVRQDTVSRLEKRSDMLLSTLRRCIEGMGGRLELQAHFPNRPPLQIRRLGGADLELALPSSGETCTSAATQAQARVQAKSGSRRGKARLGRDQAPS